MGTETPAAVAPPPETAPTAPAKPRIEARVAALLLGLLPGGLVVYFGFNGGGFFPGTVAFACVILIQLLILRVLLADHPFEGVNRGVLVVGGPLAGFATWVLLSGLWSDAHDRALIEFDRALMYLLLFLLFAFVARTPSRIPWIVRGLAAAIVVCSSVGLFSRLRPDVLHTTSDVAVNRLAYPLTYWNALGILSAAGILLCLGLASNRTDRVPVRALASGAVPILALTLYFTFSRGAILALGVGIVVFVLASRSRGLVGTFLATGPVTLVALVLAYREDALASNHPGTAVAISQGDHILKVTIVCVLFAIAIRAVSLMTVDRRLYAIDMTPERRRAGRLVAGGAAAVLLVVAIAAGGPGWVKREYHGFVHAAPANSQVDLRARLTDPSSNGRIEHWRVAIDEFDTAPLHGSGAGTYEFAWHRLRNTTATVVDGHSLYVEVMSELGIVGLVLLVAAIAGILVALARRISGPNRVLYAALLAAGVTWAIHAGIDWDWEMPAVSAWFFAVGGAALASRSGQLTLTAPAAQRSRIPVAAALAVAAATPVLILFSQSRLQDSAAAFQRGNCERAAKRAYDSINMLSVRPEPYRIIGYCDIERGRGEAAVAAMRKAVEKSPDNWESHYGLGIALAAAGRDPTVEIQRARAMNPRESFVKSASIGFRDATPEELRKAAPAQLRIALDTRRLTLR
ncbi:MAG: O-antigen ligase family protein [Thermoleophilaceae bacterium]